MLASRAEDTYNILPLQSNMLGKWPNTVLDTLCCDKDGVHGSVCACFSISLSLTLFSVHQK